VPVALEEKRQSQKLEHQRLARPYFPAQVYVQSMLPKTLRTGQLPTTAALSQSTPLVRPIAAISTDKPVSSSKRFAREGDLFALAVLPDQLRRKRVMRRWQLVCLILLVLLLLAAGVGGYYYVLTIHKTTMDQRVLPARHATTKVMDMQKQTTPLTMQNKVIPTPAVMPLFADAFRNNAQGWELKSQPGQFLAKIANGALLLENDNNMMLQEFLPGNKALSNFRLVVDAMLSKGDAINGYGFYFRATTNAKGVLSTYYRFELYGDGTYALFKGTLVKANNNGGTKVKDSKIIDFTFNPAIGKQGMLNHVIITAQGPKLTFVVNGKPLISISDGSHSSGSMALFISNRGNAKPGAQASFSNLQINPV
jgi:hypothetical protein